MSSPLASQPDCGGYFPLFVPSAGRQALVVGAGKIAARRIKSLLRFGIQVTVIAPEIDADILALESSGRLLIQRRRADAEDVTPGLLLVVAASSDRSCNRKIGLAARALNVPVSVADRKDESSFFFPAVVEGGGVVGGIISRNGNDHRLTARQAERVREALTSEERNHTHES